MEGNSSWRVLMVGVGREEKRLSAKVSKARERSMEKDIRSKSNLINSDQIIINNAILS